MHYLDPGRKCLACTGKYGVLKYVHSRGVGATCVTLNFYVKNGEDAPERIQKLKVYSTHQIPRFVRW